MRVLREDVVLVRVVREGVLLVREGVLDVVGCTVGVGCID